MRAGDGHGHERNFDLDIAFDDAGVIRSMKMRALDNVGAYAGRSPFQLGKPISAIVGPYRINSVQYRAIAVTSNKPSRRRCVPSGKRRPITPSSARWTRLRGIAGSTGWRCAGATSFAPSSFHTSSQAAPPMTAATIIW